MQQVDYIINNVSKHSKRPGSVSLARRKRMTLAWVVWFVAALFVFFQFYLQLSAGEMVSALMKSFSLTAFGGGLLASAYYYMYIIIQTPAGILMDRYGPRLILTVAAGVVCLGCLLFASAHSLGVAIFARVMMGAGAAFAFVGCLNLVAKWFPMRRFALMASIVEATGMVGTILGSLWLANFLHTVGWRVCMYASGVFAGVLSVFLWGVVRNAPRKKVIAISVTAGDLWLGVKRLLGSHLTWLNGLYSGLVFSVVTVFSALWGVPFLQTTHHLSLMMATIASCMLYLGVMVGGPIAGWLDGRYDCRRMLMGGSALICAMLLFLVIFDTRLSYDLICGLMFTSGLFAGSYVLTFAIANEIALPINRATSIGLTNMLCVGFSPILQPLIGLMVGADLHSNVTRFEWSVSMIPFLLLVAAIIAFFLPRRQFGFAKRKAIAVIE